MVNEAGEPILLKEREGAILVARMNRPERMNALLVRSANGRRVICNTTRSGCSKASAYRWPTRWPWSNGIRRMRAVITVAGWRRAWPPLFRGDHGDNAAMDRAISNPVWAGAVLCHY